DRKLAHHPRFALRAGLLPARRDRQRVRRGERRHAHRRAGRAGPAPLRRHRDPQRDRAAPGAHVAAGPDPGGCVRLSRRRAVNWLMTGLCGLSLGIALIPLVSLLWLVISRGFAGLSFDFFTAAPAPVGDPGGGAGNAIAGTLYIVGIACAI